jgi:7 transmembrane receptor (rhodopsin family)
METVSTDERDYRFVLSAVSETFSEQYNSVNNVSTISIHQQPTLNDLSTTTHNFSSHTVETFSNVFPGGVAWSVIQWLIFVVGTIGNFLIVSVLLWRRMRSQVVTQLFVGSLSMSGLALMLSSAWEQALLFANGNNWTFGRLSCQIQYYLQAVAIFVSQWTLAAVAMERFANILKYF